MLLNINKHLFKTSISICRHFSIYAIQQDPPKGLTYIDNYLTSQQHDECVTSLKQILSKYPTIYTPQFRREILNLFGKNLFNELEKHPTLYNVMLKAAKEFEMVNDKYPFNCIQINKYTSEGGCPRHVDAKTIGKIICMLSFQSSAVMDFNIDPPPDVSQEQVEKLPPQVQVLMKPGSLLVLKNDARYKWLHGVKKGRIHEFKNEKIEKSDRISLVFWNGVL